MKVSFLPLSLGTNARGGGGNFRVPPSPFSGRCGKGFLFEERFDFGRSQFHPQFSPLDVLEAFILLPKQKLHLECMGRMKAWKVWSYKKGGFFPNRGYPFACWLITETEPRFPRPMESPSRRRYLWYQGRAWMDGRDEWCCCESFCERFSLF